MTNIIHIGLGKTATTTLQQYIFPEICRLKGLTYNEPKIMPFVRKSTNFRLGALEEKLIQDQLKKNNNFISKESLVNWNPALWEKSAERNLKTFGADATIIITLREAYSYITSVYQQRIHQGNIKPPEDFFVRESSYEEIKCITANAKLEYFCTDFFCFKTLIGLYTERFAKVIVVDIENISKFDFLDGTLQLSVKEKKALAEKFKNAPRLNRGYSSLAMKLTFSREKAVRKLGLKTYGSNDRTYRQLMRDFGLNQTVKTPPRYKNLSNKQKILQLPKRLTIRVRQAVSMPSWRYLMQYNLHILIPYKKYQLPMKNLAISIENLERNNNYLNDLSSK